MSSYFQFRFAICNEIYGKLPLVQTCRHIQRIGYSGIEIAPFTLGEQPSDISAVDRTRYRDIIRSEGLSLVAMHWLMVRPSGLHLTTSDRDLRERSWRHIIEQINLCADLGDDGVIVLGSSRQRSSVPGMSRQAASANFVEGLANVARHAAERGVTILVEALPIAYCDVITTLAEAVAVVYQIGSSAVRTMFDIHNAVDETEPHAVLVERYFDVIRHVHLNEMDGRHPGTGSYDFRPVLEVLRRRGYRYWLSVEIFDFAPGPERIASESLRFLKSQIHQG